ncbi:MAG TPA: arginine deiminase-related protein [Steroidobacteraceae bacterium]|nr:arginine deiminase-related protein [Steroidobacteraceae bacterium]
MYFTKALLRPPPPTFAQGLTMAHEGTPDYANALAQHQAYTVALERCGVAISVLPAEPGYPDSCFVEDVAVLTPRGGIITRPGAQSRKGEVETVAAALRVHYPDLVRIMPPGTLDGGDICDAGGHFLIGLSARTNDEGARQLAAWLADLGYSSSTIDIRGVRGLLHLKTGLSYIGDGRVLLTSEIPTGDALAPFEQLVVPDHERYAANCVRVNDCILIAAGYPQVAAMLDRDGYVTIPLDMSEFRKMDGSLTCLSLRF